MLSNFSSDRSGTFAILTAIIVIPLILIVGFAIDGTRYYSARSQLQNATDTAALALAASMEQDQQKLEALAKSYLLANMTDASVIDLKLDALEATSKDIELTTSAVLPLTLMQIANFHDLGLQTAAKAIRAPVRKVELALVLDNTWSMSEKDRSGISKIDTLKQASRELVDQLITGDDSPIRIGIVPYADYINVGTKYRNEPWIDVGRDYTEAAKDKVCETKTQKKICLQKTPEYSCKKFVDGVPEQSTCGGDCTASEIRTVAPYEDCSGGGKGKTYKWFGCIGSRRPGTYRLNDLASTIPYPGYLETSQHCLSPIVPLSNDKPTLLAAIHNLVINIGDKYKPYTYIPAGMIWGQNVLSATEPLSEAADYDKDNIDPKKILVLMTDGDNTLRFDPNDGRHVSLSSKADKAAIEVNQTNNDTLSICSYAKNKKIEVYTIAFMVDNATAKDMLRRCATDAKHYFDASDRNRLLSAFSGIAKAINQVRLAQ
ncbi:pilus assembly protein TadG-related protein [Aureimonas sp. N4]|uniref:pilus assembly protein TadG-related protein n=1 Tax=Aureimonas sp. N4 TaxID=1638165 RepID=UPI0007863669|nr:pilus assembly protein TadG-related protein [Aureimonas sp. N4]